MATEKHALNTIEVGGTAMLLTTTGGGVAVHLTAPSEQPDSGREAVFDFYFDSDRHGDNLAGYDRAALSEPRWSETTLCGREWAIMVGGEGGPVTYDEVAFAPTCKRCLSIMDRYFPRPEPDPRLNLVAQIAADMVIDGRGFAEIHGVPGDQQAELRKVVRRLIRQRTGQSVETTVVHGVVHVVCEAIYDQHAEEGQREAVEIMGAFLSGNPLPRKKRDWVISWADWSTA